MDSYFPPISKFNILSGQSIPFNYIYSPKNACSTIKATIIRQEINPHEIAQELYGCNKVDPSKPFFVIARNPFTRFRSAFLDKIGPGNDPYVWGNICKRYNLDERSHITPSELLNCLIADVDHHEIEPHFRPQYILHNYIYLKPAFLAKFENFASITEFLTGQGFKLINWSPHSRSNSSKLFDFSSDVIDKICRLYSKDFELYGYSKSININGTTSFICQDQEVSSDFTSFCRNETG